MSYNVSYTNLPNFSNNSIGYSNNFTRYTQSNTWNSVPVNGQFITLDIGVYVLTANICYRSSPDAYAYILVDNSCNNSIFYDGSTYYPFDADSFLIYQGQNASTGGDWSAYTDGTWYPVAGQQMRNGVTGASAALSLSCILKITTPTNCATLAYSAGSSATSHTLTLVRIA